MAGTSESPDQAPQNQQQQEFDLIGAAASTILLSTRIAGSAQKRYTHTADGGFSIYDASGNVTLNWDNTNLKLSLTAAASGNTAFAAKVSGDAQDRFKLSAGGTIALGDGTSGVDISLGRTTAGGFTISGMLGLGGTTPLYPLTATYTMSPTGAQNYWGLIQITNTETAGVHSYGLTVYNTANPSINGQGLSVGISGGAFTSSSNSTNYTGVSEFMGGVFATQHAGSGTMAIAQGVKSEPYNIGSGTISLLFGMRTFFGNNHSGAGNATTTSAYGHYVQAVNDNASTINNLYGYYCDLSQMASSVSVSAVYGLYIVGAANTPGGIGVTWGVYQAGSGDQNYFASHIFVGATTPNHYLGRQIMVSSSTSAGYVWNCSGAGSDQANWDSVADTTPALKFRTVNDAVNSAVTWMQVNRGTGTALSNITFGTVLLGASGAVGGPTWSFSAETNSGWYRSGAGDIRMALGGNDLLRVTSTALLLSPSASLIFCTSNITNFNVTLTYDGATGTLAQKQSTTAQTFRVYGTTTGPKYISLKHDGTDATLDTAPSSGKLILGGNATNITLSNVALGVNGSNSAPTYSYTSETNTGWYWAGATDTRLTVGGTDMFRTTSSGCVIGSTGLLAFASSGITSFTVALAYDGASGVLAQKQGNTAQTFRTYAGNGANLGIVTVNESLTIAAAASTDSATAIPAGAVILAVAVRVTTVIPTATTFTVTAATGGNTFDTAAVSTAANSTDAGTAAGALYTSAGTKVRITPNLNPAAATGVVRLAIMYYLSTPPTS